MMTDRTEPIFECGREDCDESFYSQIGLDLHTLRDHGLTVDADSER